MSIYDPPSDPYGNEKTCWSCGHILEMSVWGEWVCSNSECDTNEGIDYLTDDDIEE